MSNKLIFNRLKNIFFLNIRFQKKQLIFKRSNYRINKTPNKSPKIGSNFYKLVSKKQKKCNENWVHEIKEVVHSLKNYP